MIYGIGVDIVEHARVQKIIQRFGERFVKRILSSEEKDIYHKKKNKIQYLASRFAAKEALGKALKIGLQFPVSFQNITIRNKDSQSPFFFFGDALNSYLSDLSLSAAHLSITHEKGTSVALVVLEIEL